MLMRSGLKKLVVCCAVVLALTIVSACRNSNEKTEKPEKPTLTERPENSPRNKQPEFNTASAMLAVIPDHYEVGEVLFSEDGRRAAYSAKHEGKFIVVVDGKAGKPYEGGVADMAFSPDSRKFVYRAADAEREPTHYIVLDGREVARSKNTGKIVFSPDSSIIGYEAQRGEKYVIGAGDKESPPFDMPYAPPLFSADSTRIAYIEQHYERNKNNLIISKIDMTERKKGKDYDLLTDITSSPDRSQLAYRALKSGKMLAVTVDFGGEKLSEREGPLNDHVSGLAFSPDSRHLAYIAKRGGKVFLVRDGREQPYPAEDMALYPLFSPDGKRIASVGSAGPQMAVILDGRAGPGYDEIGRPVFSPDGALIAYPAKKGVRWFIVVNGKEGPAAYDIIVTPQFSPDGSRVVYRARKDGRRFLVTADKAGRTLREHPRYDAVWQPVFTTDGRSVAYGVKSGRELWWKVEPIE